MKNTSNSLIETAVMPENTDNENNYYLNYSVISKDCFNDDFGRYITYGIKIICDDYSETLHDISTCGETVNWMAELFRRFQLSYVHLKDAVEDILPV